MKQNKPNTTQQINDYVRSQQQLMKQRQNAGIKKADHPRQEASAFRTRTINLTKVDYTNQLTHGVN